MLSTEPERAFSIMGYFCTKIRNGLSDEALVDAKKSRKITKNRDFGYPDLGHWYSVNKMVRIYLDFG